MTVFRKNNLALPLLIIFLLLAPRAQAGDGATLENEHIKLVIDTRQGVRIKSFYSKTQNRELLLSNNDIPLYQLDIVHAGKRYVIDPSRAVPATFSTSPDGSVEIHVSHPAEKLEVVCSISLPRNALTASFKIRVLREGSGARVGRIFYPGYALSLGERQGRQTALMPVADGQLVVDPHRNLKDKEIRSYNYPGIAAAQLMALYDGKGGLYTYAEDGDGNFKALELRRYGDGLLLLFAHITFDQEGPVIKVPYSVEAGPFEGDWKDAADLYKAWATTRSWAQVLLEDKKIPEQLQRPSYFLALNVRERLAYRKSVNRSREIPEVLQGWRSATGLPVTAILLGWEKHGYWISPDYYPPWQGEQWFKELLHEIRGQGDFSMLFLSGLHYTMEKTPRQGGDQFKADKTELELAMKSAITGLDGEPEITGRPDRHIGQYINICPATPYAYEMLRGNFLKSIEHGVDNVQIDGIVGGGLPPCFSTEHSHPPAGGATTFINLSRILQRLAAEARGRDYRAAISLEEPCEVYIPYVDMFHTREYMQANWPRDRKGVLGVPLFSYLYHEYALGYGGDHAFLTTSSQNLDAALYSQAMNLVTGKMPAGAIWMELPDFNALHPKLKSFIKDAASLMQTEAARYLLYGRFIDIEANEPPLRKIRFQKDKEAYSFDSPDVLACGFELKDGSRGLLYINATDAAITRTLAFPTAGREGEAVTIWPEKGNRINPGARYVLPPRGILFLLQQKR